MKLKTASIYGLKNKKTGELLYIGSSEDPASRFATHKSHSRKNPNQDVHSYLKANRVRIEMIILEDGGECAVGRLFLDRYSKVLYSTQATDFTAINELCDSGMALEEAIERVAQRNFPHES